MANFDMSLIQQKPSFEESITICIEPTSPLSLGMGQKGVFIKSHSLPPTSMICGMLENMMGWHFSSAHREEIVESNPKLFTDSTFRSGFISIIRPFIQIFLLNGDQIENDHYFDYNKTMTNKVGREQIITDKSLTNMENCDSSLVNDMNALGFNFSDIISLITKYKQQKNNNGNNREVEKFVEKYAGKFSKTKGKTAQELGSAQFFADLEALLPEATSKLKTMNLYSADSHPDEFYRSISALFPQYSGRPIYREFIVPKFKQADKKTEDADEIPHYEYKIRSNRKLIGTIKEAILDPQALPYLGTSESCVEVYLKEM